MDHARLLVQKLLEAGKNPADLFGLSEIGHGVGDGVVVFQMEQRRQLFLVELIHADVHIMRQHEAKEGLLLRVEIGADADLGSGSAFLARQGRQCMTTYAAAPCFAAIGAAAALARRTPPKIMTQPLASRSGTAKMRNMYCSGHS